MTERPRSIYVLSLLWLALSLIFVLWGIFSLNILLNVGEWEEALRTLVPILFFGLLISTISWFVFSSIFVILAYASFRQDSWAWSTGVILSTIFLAIFALMLAAFMVTALLFLNFFSVAGLISVVISFITDLGIIFYLTRPKTKLYLLQNSIKNNKKENNTDLSFI
jgi:hypothetical protein